MARTQFTFTFTNAQPGASVHFSVPVYADASTPDPDGPTLVLSSANAVSVWADAGFLTAITVDGNGRELSATATAGAPSVTVEADEGTAGTSPFGNGGSTPGAPVVRAFPFDHTAANLVTGHDLYTPTIGDVLIDAWIEIDTAWNGTTPTADIEQWALAATTNGGLFNGASNGAGGVDMAVPDAGDFADPTSLLIGQALSGVRLTEPLGNATLALAVSGAALTLANMDNGFRYLPARFRSASPVGVVVNETGKKGGTTAGATAGSAVLYLVTATPV